ncbi:MAG: EscU/YscU/HrcU family type III secretion system export apparatus switch protein [Treponema sp.]|nr:EscU/YscU/HrcU family type III secretion system export apparatus switch protein [Treponema sp.]
MDLQWFAAEDEGRTEEPSEVKLDKARKEGRVVKSQELNSALVLFFTVVVLLIFGKWMLKELALVMIYFFTRCTSAQWDNPYFAYVCARFFLRIVFPIAFIGSVAGVVANIAQNRGFIFSTKPIEFQFSKIIPRFGQYFKKTLFSFEGGFNVVKSLGKVAIIIAVSYAILRNNVIPAIPFSTDAVPQVRRVPPIIALLKIGNIQGSLSLIASLAVRLLATAAIIFLVISIPDYFVQKHQFIESMKMTKQEVKDEYKEMEGDPEVKNHLKQAQQQLLQRNMPRAVAESDVVITNPTHFAVALKYDPAVSDQSPQVTAKGADEMAQAIKRVARENDIPIVENRPLARGLYADTNIGDIIPEAYIRAIVTVYTQIDYYSKKK